MNLVITAAGTESLHRNYIPKESDNYELVVICYNKQAYEKFKGDKSKRVKVIYKKGFKFTLIKEYLKELKHDYYLFLDDDIFINDISKFFDICTQYRTMISHPAMSELNETASILMQNKSTTLRYVTWVELQAVCFARNILNGLIETFDENKSGWGFPELWSKMLDNLHAFAIIDEVVGVHTRPMSQNYNTQEYYKEYLDLLEKYKLERTPNEVIGKVYKSKLSVCIMFKEDHSKYITECVESLPINSEIVLVKTIPDKEKRGIDNVIRNQNIYAEYYYDESKRFHYGMARNAVKSLATREWILSLDADERLAPHEHKTISRSIESAGANIGGFISNSVSVSERLINKGKPIKSEGDQCRLFRNHPDFTWRGGIHEDIDTSIQDAGFELIYSTFTILHEGYNVSPVEMMEKMERNVETAFEYSSELSESRKIQIVRDAHSLHELREQLKGKNNGKFNSAESSISGERSGGLVCTDSRRRRSINFQV